MILKESFHLLSYLFSWFFIFPISILKLGWLFCPIGNHCQITVQVVSISAFIDLRFFAFGICCFSFVILFWLNFNSMICTLRIWWSSFQIVKFFKSFINFWNLLDWVSQELSKWNYFPILYFTLLSSLLQLKQSMNYWWYHYYFEIPSFLCLSINLVFLWCFPSRFGFVLENSFLIFDLSKYIYFSKIFIFQYYF